jgi:hypothetical protein
VEHVFSLECDARAAAPLDTAAQSVPWWAEGRSRLARLGKRFPRWKHRY